MKFVRKGSIQRKLTLVIFFASVLGLSFTCLAFELYERAAFRSVMTSELSAHAEMLGLSTAGRTPCRRWLYLRHPRNHLCGVPACRSRQRFQYAGLAGRRSVPWSRDTYASSQLFLERRENREHRDCLGFFRTSR